MRTGRAEGAFNEAVVRMIADDPAMLGLSVRHDPCGNHVTITADFNLVLTVDEYDRMTEGN